MNWEQRSRAMLPLLMTLLYMIRRISGGNTTKSPSGVLGRTLCVCCHCIKVSSEPSWKHWSMLSRKNKSDGCTLYLYCRSRSCTCSATHCREISSLTSQLAGNSNDLQIMAEINDLCSGFVHPAAWRSLMLLTMSITTRWSSCAKASSPIILSDMVS